MFNRIEEQINEFTNGIKEAEGCDKLLSYMNTNYFASVKLLMFSSPTFSLYAKLMMFFMISSGGLLMSSSIGVIPIDYTIFLAFTILLFALILIFFVGSKRLLLDSIEKKKASMMEEQKETE